MSFYRDLDSPLDLVDRNTLEGLLVPWDEVATVIDLREDGTPERYRERFERGAFDLQIRSGNEGVIRKVELRDQHEGGLGKMGYALTLEDRDEGLWGRFRVREANVTDVRQMYEDGIDGLSVSFHPLPRGGTRVDGNGSDEVRTRTRAYLEHAALVSTPAYSTARVLALRDVEGGNGSHIWIDHAGTMTGGALSVVVDEALAVEDSADRRRREFDEIDAWLAETRAKRLQWRPAASNISD